VLVARCIFLRVIQWYRSTCGGDYRVSQRTTPKVSAWGLGSSLLAAGEPHASRPQLESGMGLCSAGVWLHAHGALPGGDDRRRDRRRGNCVFVAGSTGSGRVGCGPHLGRARCLVAGDSRHVGRGPASRVQQIKSQAEVQNFAKQEVPPAPAVEAATRPQQSELATCRNARSVLPRSPRLPR